MENNKSALSRVTGIFESNKDASGIYEALLSRGFDIQDITVIMSDLANEGFHSQTDENSEQTHATDDAERGALLGGATGAVVSAIAAIGATITLPGIGLVLAGPLLAGLAGATAGSIAGGTIGAIVGSGYPKDEAEYYESSIRKGGIMISVSPRNDSEKKILLEDFKKYNGQKIYVDDHSLEVDQ